QHVEVPVPSPKKGEVLLKMEAASINPIDWKIQKGMLRPFLPGKFPFTPGTCKIIALSRKITSSCKITAPSCKITAPSCKNC
uniref:Alcohol dehydrogenase-like N-terminal domain-containing protein n=1 Tax=Aegilops tauschii subsp. strangulata TaxID=200361 RepID=A0A453L790_AEGTS